ncbi:alcohol dehydrogenase catalytic domain-containing protein [Paenibacillus hamazuiensis]|uniref:alcohol dehydrogenase catalytic domain-containing protein n=1 Tax=Paenibacillus hamazuiensis TaxID=2936508 RepID=UPI00200C0C25|nr:alcohol dehydrogenase catalytic domain-containing protein [Paenibacillus hamazuiensis]
MMNTQMILKEYGGTDTMCMVEEPLRRPEPDEVRVRVLTARVALTDIMRREGKYPNPPAPPFTPGYDVVGVEDESGENMGQFRQGDRVAVFYNSTGGYSA